jgi:citrate lyase subunit beta/citryl-CoA lyase
MDPDRARRWRSLHFVPGASERMLARAATLGADALILDLEDAVPPEGKEPARARVAEWLGATTCTAARLVRVNPLDSPWGRDDLAAILPARPDGLVVPKVASAADLAAVDRELSRLERAHGISAGSVPIVAIATETPRAVLRLEEIADGPRIAGLTWGSEDLSALLGANRTRADDGRYLPVFEIARQLTLLAAHAAGVAAIDGVYTDFRDVAGLEREAAEAAASGFTGKLTIHPMQIEPVHRAFTPAPETVEHARALLAAWDEHRAAGRGAFAFEGQMIDAPHLARARALLERAGS